MFFLSGRSVWIWPTGLLINVGVAVYLGVRLKVD